MSELRLFRLRDDSVEQLAGSAVALEKSLQTLIERHCETLLGVRFLATEYRTTKSQGWQIDTLGIDENNSPVIIEYKRAQNENVINQGLSYLTWLLEYRADFKWLVLEKLGTDVAAAIEWGSPRLICIAGDFTKYDQHAIQQMPRNIDLVRYRRYGDDLLLLEQFASSRVDLASEKGQKKPSALSPSKISKGKSTPTQKPGKTSGQPKILDTLDQCPPEVRVWYEALRDHAKGLGDGVHEHIIDRYIAFRGLTNFAYILFRPVAGKIDIEVKLDQATVEAESGFVKPASGKRYWPRFQVASAEDVKRAIPLITRSYESP